MRPLILFILLLAGASVKVSGQTETQVWKRGRVYSITLNSNPSTGYSWVRKNEASSSITLDSKMFIPDKPAMPGSPGKELLSFKGRKLGIDSLVFEYQRSWEPNKAAKRKVFIIKIVP